MLQRAVASVLRLDSLSGSPRGAFLRPRRCRSSSVAVGAEAVVSRRYFLLERRISSPIGISAGVSCAAAMLKRWCVEGKSPNSFGPPDWIQQEWKHTSRGPYHVCLTHGEQTTRHCLHMTMTHANNGRGKTHATRGDAAIVAGRITLGTTTRCGGHGPLMPAQRSGRMVGS